MLSRAVKVLVLGLFLIALQVGCDGDEGSVAIEEGRTLQSLLGSAVEIDVSYEWRHADGSTEVLFWRQDGERVRWDIMRVDSGGPIGGGILEANALEDMLHTETAKGCTWWTEDGKSAWVNCYDPIAMGYFVVLASWLEARVERQIPDAMILGASSDCYQLSAGSDRARACIDVNTSVLTLLEDAGTGEIMEVQSLNQRKPAGLGAVDMLDAMQTHPARAVSIDLSALGLPASVNQ